VHSRRTLANAPLGAVLCPRGEACRLSDDPELAYEVGLACKIASECRTIRTIRVLRDASACEGRDGEENRTYTLEPPANTRTSLRVTRFSAACTRSHSWDPAD
jgi:hypothetical protein